MKSSIKTPDRWELSRRQLLRDLGLGAACLPLLRAGLADAATPKKLLIVASIYGYRIPSWQPADGPLMLLPKSMVPLDAHKGDLNVVHDLANPGFTGCATCGEYDYATIYSGLPPRPGSPMYQEPNGPTVDQVIAGALPAPASGRPTINTAIQISQAPVSATTPGERDCFWLGKQEPINPIVDPLQLYDDLVAGAGGGADPQAAKKLILERKSILDYVNASLDRFKLRLGTDDRAAMDAHKEAIRETEVQLSGATLAASCGAVSPGIIDFTQGSSYPKVLSALVNLCLAALRCGVTQVATIQLADAIGESVDFGAFVPGIPAQGTGYSPPATRNWHDIAHNPILSGVDHKQIVDQWWMAQLADIVAKMKASPDGAGTLFDNSVVLWGNNMQEGANHAAQKLPWLLAGNCGGYFKTGQCLTGKTTTMVLADICEAMGVSQHPYGATTPGLRA